MKLKQEQLQRLAERVYSDLDREGLVTPRAERGRIIEGISAAISRDFDQEQALERDAEKLLDDTIRSMGRAAADIDRRKMLKMIKDKLARERKMVL